jgi:hypothetical protein
MANRQNTCKMKKALEYEIVFFKETTAIARHNYEIYFDSNMKENCIKLL